MFLVACRSNEFLTLSFVCASLTWTVPTEEALRSLSKNFRNSFDRIVTLKLEYNLHHTRSQALLDRGKRSDRVMKNLQAECFQEFSLKSSGVQQFWRILTRDSGITDENYVWTRGPFKYFYRPKDGQASISLGVHRDLVFSIWNITYKPLPNYEETFAEILMTAGRKGEIEIRTAFEGNILWLEFKTKDGYLRRIRVLPEKGYLIDRIENGSEKIFPQSIYENFVFQQVSKGIWFPSSARRVDSPDGSDFVKQPYYSIEYQLKSIEVNVPIIQKELEMELPNGTVVQNVPCRLKFTKGKEDELRQLFIEGILDEAIESAPND